jgi:hypothetical protein
MKTVYKILVCLILFSSLLAENDPYIIKQKWYVVFLPTYQGWRQNGNDISQISVPVYAYAPLSRSLGLTLRNNPASATGDNLADLKGFTDTQIGLSYHLEAANLVLHLGVGVPSGLRELTIEEFQTSVALSFDYFDFRAPNFGKGFTAAPGFSWAFPASEKVVLGLGASYLYNGKYQPIAEMPQDYDAGDEIQFTAGFDILFNPTTFFTGDVIYTLYEADKLGEQEVFESGDKFVANLQFQKFFAFNELLLQAIYRGRGKNSMLVNGELQLVDKTATPDQFGLFGLYRLRIHPKFYLGFIAEGRYFQETDLYPALFLIGGGIAPEMTLSTTVKIISRFKFLGGQFENAGNLNGLEAGLGVRFGF